MTMDNNSTTQNRIIAACDCQERYWLENTARLMRRVEDYTACIKASMERGEMRAVQEHVEMLAKMAKDEGESCRKQLNEYQKTEE